MELNVRERVHVMPLGHEVERIVDPAIRYRADRVVLITHEDNDETGVECLHQVEDRLNDQKIDYQAISCNIFDLYDSLETIAETIAKFDDHDVYVNVSTGSKITGMAGMIASMVLDCTAYYVRATDYDGTPSDINIDDYQEIPRYPIDGPDTDQVTVLEYIHRNAEIGNPPSKGAIIYFSLHVGLEYISDDPADKGRYRLLDNHVIDPLLEQDYVTERKQGREVVLQTTENGRGALSAFKWLVNSDIDWDRWVGENQQDPEVED